MNPILFVDLFRQASYKTTLLFSVINKQLTYFSKKYSKYTRITLNKSNRLSIICNKDNIKAIKYVSKKINVVDYKMFVFKSAKYGNLKLVRFCYNNGFDIQNTTYEPSRYNLLSELPRYNLLSFGCKFGHLKLVVWVLHKNVKNWQWNYNRCLYIGSKYGHLKIVELLLKNGANIHTNNNCALQVSISNGHTKMVKLLLNNGACVHDLFTSYNLGLFINETEDCTMLWLSVAVGNLKITRMLLHAGADIHNDYNYDILAKCAMRGDTEMAELLLAYGADIHYDNDFALRISAKKGHFETVNLLLEKGANIHAKNDYALVWSAKNGHSKIVKLLLNKGANLHAVDINDVPTKIKNIIRRFV